MKNADMPAMPIPPDDNGQVEGHPYPGLTKREMFAKDAPKMPEWFVQKYLKDIGYEATTEMVGTTIIDKENMPYPHEQMYFAWRTYYADNMLAQLEESNQ